MGLHSSEQRLICLVKQFLKVTNEGSCLLLRHESLNEEIIPQGPLITLTRNNGSGREKEEDRDKGFIEG